MQVEVKIPMMGHGYPDRWEIRLGYPMQLHSPSPSGIRPEGRVPAMRRKYSAAPISQMGRDKSG